jgi:hypothetical protein
MYQSHFSVIDVAAPLTLCLRSMCPPTTSLFICPSSHVYVQVSILPRAHIKQFTQVRRCQKLSTTGLMLQPPDLQSITQQRSNVIADADHDHWLAPDNVHVLGQVQLGLCFKMIYIL